MVPGDASAREGWRTSQQGDGPGRDSPGADGGTPPEEKAEGTTAGDVHFFAERLPPREGVSMAQLELPCRPYTGPCRAPTGPLLQPPAASLQALVRLPEADSKCLRLGFCVGRVGPYAKYSLDRPHKSGRVPLLPGCAPFCP